MSLLLRLASRNLWRNRRRTLLTLSAMVVSLALLTLSLGVFSGMLFDILSSTTEQYHGHLVINAEGYLDDRDMYKNFPTDAALLKRLQQDERVRGLSQRLRGFGLVSHGESSYPAELLGIRPELEKSVTKLHTQLIAGEFPADRDGDGAVLGSSLAKKLGVSPGDELVFVTQAADGSIGNDLLFVRAIFRTGHSGHDNNLVLVPLAWLQRIMALEGKIHEIALAVEDPLLAADDAKRLSPLLPGGLKATDWGELLPEMREAIASFDVSRFIFVIILYFATGLGILNTVFMSVMERTREFGILMAIGMGPRRLVAGIVIESLLLTLLGVGIGLAVGTLSVWLLRDGIDLSRWAEGLTAYGIGTKIVPVIRNQDLIFPTLVAVITAVVASLWPALRAVRIRPADAVRHT